MQRRELRIRDDPHDTATTIITPVGSAERLVPARLVRQLQLGSEFSGFIPGLDQRKNWSASLGVGSAFSVDFTDPLVRTYGPGIPYAPNL